MATSFEQTNIVFIRITADSYAEHKKLLGDFEKFCGENMIFPVPKHLYISDSSKRIAGYTKKSAAKIVKWLIENKVKKKRKEPIRPPQQKSQGFRW